jgi:RND family efflux transporter MFP subunit
VQVIRVEQGTMARTVTVSGTLAAQEEVTVAFKVTGRTGELLVDLGSRVKRGQVLARLEPTDFELRVQQAEAALEQARARLGLTVDAPGVEPEDTALVRQAAAVLDQARLTRDRMISLHEQGMVSKAQRDDADAAYRVADARYQDAIEEVRNRQALIVQRTAELELARQQLAGSILVSPITGAVQERLISRGQYMSAGEPAFRLVSIHPLRLRLAVPEREAAGIRAGLEVRVHVEGDPKAHPGKLARISPAISTGDRTLAVEAEIPNPEDLLRPGTFARAEIVVQAEDPALVVPASAIVTFAGVEKVIAVENNVTVEKRIRTGRRNGESVEILEGLDAGAVVVVTPGNMVGGESVQTVS